MPNKIKPIRNFLGFDILDQTLEKKPNIVYDNIWSKICLINKHSQKYGITLTFSSKWHIEDSLTLHRIVISKITKSTVCKNINYIFFPEFTKGGILHYHGIIWDCYQLPFIRFSRWWSRTFGFTKPELELRYYLCNISAKCTQSQISKAKHCWSHYITKDYGKNGLWTLTHY